PTKNDAPATNDAPAKSPAPAQGVPPSLGKSLSVTAPGVTGNRFQDGDGFSRPFIFGIDDALIGTLVGPIIKVLPELLNPANNAKVQMKQADDKLMSDIVSDVGKRLLLLQIANSQPVANASPELQKQLQQAATAPSPAEGGVATGKSLSLSDIGGDALSSR